MLGGQRNLSDGQKINRFGSGSSLEEEEIAKEDSEFFLPPRLRPVRMGPAIVVHIQYIIRSWRWQI